MPGMKARWRAETSPSWCTDIKAPRANPTVVRTTDRVGPSTSAWVPASWPMVLLLKPAVSSWFAAESVA